LEATVRELPEMVDIRILVDDHSKDGTVVWPGAGIAGFTCMTRNYGYGRSTSNIYREGSPMRRYVIMVTRLPVTPLLDGHGQHDCL